MSITTSSRRATASRSQAGSNNPSEGGLGLRSTLGEVRQKTPRRAGQWAAAVLFVVIVVVGLLAVFQSQSTRVEVLAVTAAVPAGEVIESGDLRPVDVAGVDGAIPAADVDTVVGRRAASGLVEGQLLTESALTDALVPAEGERLVAIDLPTGRVPGALATGEQVAVLAVPAEGTQGAQEQLEAPTVLAESAGVQSVEETPEGTRVVTLVVPEGDADQVAAFSAAGQVTILQTPLTGEE